MHSAVPETLLVHSLVECSIHIANESESMLI